MTPTPPVRQPVATLRRLLVRAALATLPAACATNPAEAPSPRPADVPPGPAAAIPAEPVVEATETNIPFHFCSGRVAARIATPEAYAMAIHQKICINIRLPRGVEGDPSVVFRVVQQASGRITAVRLVRSSGNRALDRAIASAIRKSSPLPRPDKPELFNPTLELKFYPLRG